MFFTTLSYFSGFDINNNTLFQDIDFTKDTVANREHMIIICFFKL